jgi:solute carrier family 25 phosphate transporter 23/24/25/41
LAALNRKKWRPESKRLAFIDESVALLLLASDNTLVVVQFSSMTTTVSSAAKGERPLLATDADIVRTFQEYDTNDDKSLSVLELKQALTTLKLRVADSDLQTLLSRIDTDKSNSISFDEFKTFYREREATLYTAWTTLNAGNTDSSGLTAAGLRGGLSLMNLKVSDDEIRKFIRHLDRNKDGQVSFDEFRECLLFLPQTSARAVFDSCRDSMYIQHSNGEYSPPLDLVQARLPSRLQGAFGMLLSPVSAQLIGYCIAHHCD